MEKEQIKGISVIGITVRTSNQNGEGARDIPALWGRFYSEDIASKIPNKIGNDLYGVYTDYEGDYMKPYTTLVGCRVDSLEEIPDGMRGLTIKGGEYLKLTAKGNLMNGVVYQGWERIWNTDLNRSYIADFEVYGEKAKNPMDAEVGIFVGIR
ncbi:GyrI-like domain-containing protein [Pedobacter foliorum]|uniref:GyrI-like domain-containing protein n=1 Tax=Pedobacter foliorum TaxID=2739058 RepID=UPI0015649200|nr:GyrI-like domain-containing protein [Pedobacter foliorum]NRF39391.1 effector binding domain-containing protein [Pedobacter foliorum]